MIKKLAIGCLFAATVAKGLAAQSIQGVWGQSQEICNMADPGDNPPIIVTENSIRYYEASCTLENPTSLRDMPEGKLYDQECWAEGEYFDAGRAFIATNGLEGLIIYESGYATTYVRC